MQAKLTKLIIQLQQLNIEINAEEVADWLWLAAYKAQYTQQPEQLSDSYQLPEIKPNPDKIKDDTPAQEQPFKSDTSKAKESTAELHTQQQPEQSSLTQEASTNALPFHTPAARALPHSLAISRALRPLVRRVASCSTLEIDEQATVQQIADMGIWLPVMRPQNVRWLELVLVIEDSPSMRLWYHTIKELQQLLEQQGAFSDIRVWRLKTEAKTQNVSLHTQSDLDARYPRHYKELINPAQRRLILVVSDCISPAWQSETLLNWLDAWGRQHSLTLINMLPQQLWTQTRLRYARLVKLSNSQAATANCYLQQQQTLPSWRKKLEKDRLPIPLTTLEPDFLGLWAKFVVGNNANILMPSFVFHAEPLLTPQPTTEIDEESRFQRFHSVATPTAFQLACYLAAAPLLQLPIIRLVQRVMFRPEQVQQVYLAEVFLSGLLKRISSDNCHPDKIEYDFLSDTLRDRFLDAGLLTDTVQVWEGISEYINAHYGCTLDFQAWLFNPKAENDFVLTDKNRGFAKVSARILRRLGGEYEKLVDFLEGKEGIAENLEIPNKEIDKNYNDDLITAIPLNEAKLIMVGDGSVGKTSLVNRLLHDKFETNPKIKGIDRHQWNLLIDKDNIRLNVWDFGGQEVLHATHQFFLTKNSLYILVLDARRGEQESRLEYWLKLIQCFGSDSPILIAINKSDEYRSTLNQRFLKDKYPNIKEFYSISCVTGQGIAELKQGIKNTIALLPHIHFLMPASWFKLKQSLEQSTKNYISYDDYKNLCVQNEITEQISQSTLCSFLNDLGVVLNFNDQNFDRLHDTIVLNPEWITNAVYKILNATELFINHGVFSVKHLERMLDTTAYPNIIEHQFIIDIMQKIELCFPIPDTKDYLIPELLQNEEPDLKWNKDDSLGFEYHYDVLLYSVFSRFIVRLYELISQQTYWRTGVVLAHEKSKALIKSDIEDKKIFIWVTGDKKNRKILLGIIRKEFKYIHSTIKGLEVKEFVSLPKHPKIVIEYDFLLKLQEKNTREYYYPASGDVINVPDLLNSIETSDETESQSTRNEFKNFGLAKSPEDAYNACNPDKALFSGDPRYVDLSKVRNHNSISIITRPIMRCQQASVFCKQLVVGNRGCGKTTELHRLQHELEGNGYFSIYIDAGEVLDLADITYQDILLSIAQCIVYGLDKANISIDVMLQEDLHNWLVNAIDIKDIFGDKYVVRFGNELKSSAVSRCLAILTSEIRNGSSQRYEIRRALESSEFIRYLNALLDEARSKLQKQGYVDLVVIVDSLEKIHYRQLGNNESSYSSLFVRHAEQLNTPNCHIVYTIPIGLTYDTDMNNVFSNSIYFLPMIRYREVKGIHYLVELIAKRVDIESVFEDISLLKQLIALSGGSLRGLLRLVRMACETAEDKISQADINRASRNFVKEFDRLIKTEDIPALKYVSENKSITGDKNYIRLLQMNLILEYENGKLWADLHPALLQIDWLMKELNTESL